MTIAALTSLAEGAIIPFGGDRYATVPPELATVFRAGDQLHVVQATGALLHVPKAVRSAVATEVDAAVDAFAQLRTTTPNAVERFYAAFATALADDATWEHIEAANTNDVARAKQLGRSTTRLSVSTQMRREMIAGLRGWAVQQSGRAGGDAADLIERVEHDGWSVEIVSAPLGVIGFVFEGRPNVFADAAGVLATGNTAVLRIGGDALSTAQAIEQHALRPALLSAGLPEGAISLVGVRDRAAGWALFSDTRLALAVVRGSGAAVTQLGSVARQNGIPVSAHGTGGAWLVADSTADTERFARAIRHSLDRKVCNTLNVVAVVRDRAAELVPVLLEAADEAAATRGGDARVHIASGSERWVPPDEFKRHIKVRRAERALEEPRATVLPLDELGTEWEWEDTPELSIVVVDDVDHAAALFNTYSPQFVASFVSTDRAAHARFRDQVNAPFVGDGFTRWVDGQYALERPELGLSNWENGRLLGRAGVLTGADLTTRRTFAYHDSFDQHR